MTLRVSGKNLQIGEALQDQVRERMAGALTKYFDGDYSGHVTVARDGTGFRTDCVVHLTSGTTLEASGAAQDAYQSFEQGAEHIEKRLRRYKRRLKDRAPGAGRSAPASEAPYAVLEAPPDGGSEVDYHPAVIAETTRALHRFSVSEAVFELDVTGAPIVVFVHAGSGRLNVVYRRNDGAIGWIDPRLGQALT